VSRRGETNEKRGDALKLKTARFLLRAIPALLIVLMLSSGGSAMDHSDLAKVLKTMPPNGPFWKYGNVVMRAKSRKTGMAPVVFSHWSHRSRYTCRVCHQELGFSMRQGDSGITRDQYLAGKFCGACHNGSTAFTVKDGPQAQCKKCHMENTKDLEKQFSAFSESLPMAPFGNGIDWAAAVKDGTIRPVNFLKSSEAIIQFPDKLKQPLKLGTASPRSDVNFSHEDHFAELDCSSCHPDIFNIKKKTTAAFSMDSNVFGGFCGACHMQVAFPMNDCKRCHQSMSNPGF
jgi:c(7)-type cytochrome triheme protein